MTNLYHKQHGAITLVLTTILLTTMTLLVIFAADYTLKQQKISGNQLRNQQAYEAAEAGIEFAIPYLKKNKSTILAYQVGGTLLTYSDSNTSNVTLANGAKYTIVYGNPISNNFQLILITVTGTSSDGVATTTMKQLVKEQSLLSNLPDVSFTTKQTINVSGNSSITNLITNKNVTSGQSVTFAGNGKTYTISGETSNSSTIGSDVTQNDASIQAMSNDQFFTNYMGTSPSNFKSQSSAYYQNSSSTNYSATLDGQTGKTIWIDQTSGTATINSGTVGSAVNPVILVVNGDFSLSGTAVVYGVVFSMGGALTVTGKAQISGGFLSAGTGDISFAGNDIQPGKVVYDSTIISLVQQLMVDYSKVPGSWRDY